jgi:hypothetical protein
MRQLICEATIERSNPAEKNTTALKIRIDYADAGIMGIANSIRPAVQFDQTGVFRTQVTKIKSRLFIRETAQPETS